VRDPGGNRILRERRATNSFGSFSGQVEISPEAPTGSFSLIYDIDGEKHTADITVASYRKPEFTVTATPDRPRYVRGETVAVALSGRYYFGAPVAGAKVRYSIFRDADWASEYPDDYEPDEGERPGPAGGGYGDYYGQTVSEGETTLDEAGKAVVRFPAGATGGRDGADDAAEETPRGQIYTLYATVTDAAGRSVEAQGRARVVQGDFRLALRPEGYVAEPGKPISIVVQARDHENKPVEGVSLTLDAVYSAWDPEKKRAETEPLATESARTGTDGNALVAITPGRGGEIRLTARASDRAGRAVRGRGYLWAADDAGGDLQTEYADLSLLTDKRRYRPGDTARVLLNAARTGQTALLTIEGERSTRPTVPITRRSTVVRVPIRDLRPNVVLAACYVGTSGSRPAKPRSASRFPPARCASPCARTGRSTGQATRSPIRYGTTDAAGRPAPCEFSFGVVDESIYALREDDPHGLRKRFLPAPVQPGDDRVLVRRRIPGRRRQVRTGDRGAQTLPRHRVLAAGAAHRRHGPGHRALRAARQPDDLARDRERLHARHRRRPRDHQGGRRQGVLRSAGTAALPDPDRSDALAGARPQRHRAGADRARAPPGRRPEPGRRRDPDPVDPRRRGRKGVVAGHRRPDRRG
jgi:hypothetical protein